MCGAVFLYAKNKIKRHSSRAVSMKFPRFLTVIFILTGIGWPVTAIGEGPQSLPVIARGEVTEVVDGAVVRIEGVNVDVRLVSIQAPKLPKGRVGFTPWPLANEAREALADLVLGHNVALHAGTTPRDRNGRILAHVVRSDGLWVQSELLRLGWARVYTFADNRRFAPDLYASEQSARAAERGIWAESYYAIRSANPGALAKDIGTFQVVEGRIVSAARVRGRVYLNFGEDYRSDFTATIPPDAASVFRGAGFDPLELEGKVVRVRGYLRDYNGPVIDLTHPEQIDIQPQR